MAIYTFGAAAEKAWPDQDPVADLEPVDGEDIGWRDRPDDGAVPELRGRYRHELSRRPEGHEGRNPEAGRWLHVVEAAQVPVLRLRWRRRPRQWLARLRAAGDQQQRSANRQELRALPGAARSIVVRGHQEERTSRSRCSTPLTCRCRPTPGTTRWIKPFEDQIASNMQSCASSGLYFEVGPNQGISEAMNALFQKAVAMARLTK